MDVKRLDKQRTEIFHFVLWLLLVLLAVIGFLSFRQGQGGTIPLLVVVSLSACLYAVSKERRLRRRQMDLRRELSQEQDRPHHAAGVPVPVSVATDRRQHAWRNGLD